MDFEDSMLSEITHTEKDKYHMICYQRDLRKQKLSSQLQRTDWWLPEVGGWEKLVNYFVLLLNKLNTNLKNKQIAIWH